MFFMTCQHEWDKVSDLVTESTFEMTLRTTKDSSGNIPHQLCQDNRKHIVILKCGVCGKVKKLVTNL